MGSMHTGLEEDKEGLQRLAAFYRERVQGGVGLIVTGGFSPNHWIGTDQGKIQMGKTGPFHQTQQLGVQILKRDPVHGQAFDFPGRKGPA